MGQTKELPSRQEGIFLYALNADAERRLAARLFLSCAGVSVEGTHLPLGGSSGVYNVSVNHVLDFFGCAQEGFRMYLRADRETKEVVDGSRLLGATAPLDVAKFLKKYGMNVLPKGSYGREVGWSPHLESSTEKPSLPIFQQVFATLVYLNQFGTVRLLDMKSPHASRLGKIGEIPTVWTKTLTNENLWYAMEEFQQTLVNAIYGTGVIQNREKILRATVFFSAGRHLAQVIAHF